MVPTGTFKIAVSTAFHLECLLLAKMGLLLEKMSSQSAFGITPPLNSLDELVERSNHQQSEQMQLDI